MSPISHDFASPSEGGWLRQGLSDMKAGLAHWRFAYLLGIGEIRRRYSRSRLGQFWLTLSTAVMVCSMALVWSHLWKSPMGQLMPYIIISLILWSFVSGALTEAPDVFVAYAPIMQNQGIAFSTFVLALILKHLAIFAHNLPIILPALLIAGRVPGIEALESMIGLFFLVIFLGGLSCTVAILSLRFRDLRHIVQNVITALFFVTPILWTPEQIDEKLRPFVHLNPLYSHFALVVRPLLGLPVGATEWWVAIGSAAAAALLALVLLGWSKRHLIYWI